MTSAPYLSSLSSVTPSICSRTSGSEESFSVHVKTNETCSGTLVIKKKKKSLTIVPEITSYLFQSVSREDVVIVNSKSFPQLLAQIRQLLQALLNHLFSLGDVLGHSSFVFPDAGRALRLIEVHLQ